MNSFCLRSKHFGRKKLQPALAGKLPRCRGYFEQRGEGRQVGREDEDGSKTPGVGTREKENVGVTRSNAGVSSRETIK